MSFILLNSLSEIEQMVSDYLTKAKEEKLYIGFDTETARAEDDNSKDGKTALSPHLGRLRLLQFSDGNECYVIDCFKFSFDDLSRILEPIFIHQNIVKIGHNIKFDYQFVLKFLKIRIKPLFCTMIADNILGFRKQKGWHGLESNAYKWLGIKMDKTMQKSDWSLPVLSRRQLEYAANDVKILPTLRQKQVEELKKTKQLAPAKLELDVLPVVAEMELAGLRLDEEYHKRLIDRLKIERDEKETALNTFLDEKLNIKKTFTYNIFGNTQALDNEETINVRSSAQLLKAFQKLGYPVTSTDSMELEPLMVKYPDIKYLLDFRESEKLVSTYGEKLRNTVNRKTGRIHCSFRQIGADTLRFSSSGPNLQNCPREDWFRECFRPKEGFCYSIFDYSNIELRIAADLSKDKVMLDAFENDVDLHSLTASKVFGIPIEYLDKKHERFNENKEKRSIAKTLNFGIVYGIGALGLQLRLKLQGIDVSEKEAQQMINGFYETYPELREWLYLQERITIKNQSIRTAAGYLIKTPFDKKDSIQVGAVKRKGRNYQIQNLSAAITKYGLILINKYINEYNLQNAEIVNVVHDEVITEHLLKDAEAMRDVLYRAGMESQRVYLKDVKVVVKPVLAESWADKE